MSLPPPPLIVVLRCLHRRRSSWMGRSCTLCCGGCLPWPTVTWRSTSWSPSCTWQSGSCAPSLGRCRGPQCCESGTCSFVRVRRRPHKVFIDILLCGWWREKKHCFSWYPEKSLLPWIDGCYNVMLFYWLKTEVGLWIWELARQTFPLPVRNPVCEQNDVISDYIRCNNIKCFIRMDRALL